MTLESFYINMYTICQTVFELFRNILSLGLILLCTEYMLSILSKETKPSSENKSTSTSTCSENKSTSTCSDNEKNKKDATDLFKYDQNGLLEVPWCSKHWIPSWDEDDKEWRRRGQDKWPHKKFIVCHS